MKSKFETLLVGIQASVGDDPDCLNRTHSKYIAAKTGSGRNVSQYENPTVDKLLEDGVREIDRAKRRALYLKLQEVIRTDLAYLPIFSYVRIEGVKQGIVNYTPNSNTLTNSWNMHEWGWKAKVSRAVGALAAGLNDRELLRAAGDPGGGGALPGVARRVLPPPSGAGRAGGQLRAQPHHGRRGSRPDHPRVRARPAEPRPVPLLGQGLPQRQLGPLLP